MVLMKLWTLRQRPASQLKHALSQEWKQWSGIRDLVKVSKALQNHYNSFKAVINALEQWVKFAQSQQQRN